MNHIHTGIFAGPIGDKFKEDLVSSLMAIDGVKGVFLAGSGAHQELLWSKTGDVVELVSDVEVGVMTSRLSSRASFRKISLELSKQYNYDVEIFIVTPRRFKLGTPKNLSFRQHTPNILMYDLLSSADWLYGKKPDNAAVISSEEIPVWEGIRLILNRMGEGAEQLIPWFLNSKVNDYKLLSRWLIKFLLALGDALLLSRGKYISGYVNRSEVWENLTQYNVLTPHTVNAISRAFASRKGKGFDVTDLDPVVIRKDASALFMSFIKLTTSNQYESEEIFLNCVQYFEKSEIPVRFQAPLSFLDRWYDSLFLIPSIKRSNISFNVLSRLLKYKMPLQGYAYTVLAATIFSGNLSRGLSWFENTVKPFTTENMDKNTEYFLKEWWNVFCK